MTHQKIIRLTEVIERTGMSRSLIYMYIKLGKFPQQVKLGERAVGWLSSEIDQYIYDRISDRSVPLAGE